MWSIITTQQTSSSITFRIQSGVECISQHTFVQLFVHEQLFRIFYTQVLSELPFAGFFWENKPMCYSNMQTEYECTIHATTDFKHRRADESAFKEQMDSVTSIVSFMNLGKDALLIAPKQISNSEHYLHLATFLRNGDPKQIDAFWKAIGQELAKAINEEPIWLSTSGLGIQWLHARIDKQPKYYKTDSYKIV